jgi:4-amino-4-deoxy-L-arabinose transferase-like glycosyltransferase
MSVITRRIVIFALLSCFFVQSFNSLSSKSATFDEVQYFGIGKHLLTKQKWDVMGAVLHPPLSYYISSIPLLFVDLDERFFKYEENTVKDLNFFGAIDYYRGQGILSSEKNNGDRLLISSRLMIVVLSLFLGYYIYRFSSELYGEKSGILSLFLFTFCPNMLAFSGIAVPDMPLTVFSFIAVYYFWLSSNNGSKKNKLLAGLFLGLALLSKFTALLLLPIYLLIALVSWAKQKNNSLLLSLIIVFSIAAIVFMAGYSFDLTPFFQGNEYRMSQQKNGQATFLMGQYSDHGWWSYYSIAFLLKTPLPVILLLCLSIVLYFRNRTDRLSELTFLLLPIVTFLVVFSASSYCIALRYILPIYPFIFVVIGSLAAYGGRYNYLICLMSVWYVGASLYISPHYLAYFNEAIGGPNNGYKYLVDGNLDWGQDLKGLKKYMVDNGVAKVSLSYFGADSPERYGIKYDWLPSYYLYNPEPGKAPEIKPNQLLAISATNLQGVYLDNKEQYKWLKKYKPVAKIGYSIFIYDLSRQSAFKAAM